MKKKEEQKFDEMLQVDNEDFNVDQKKFKKANSKIHISLWLKLIKVICVIVFCIGVGTFTLSKIIDSQNLSPKGLSFTVKHDEKTGNMDDSDLAFQIMITNFYKTIRPNIDIYFENGVFQSEGFATYSADISVRRLGYGNYFERKANGILKLKASNLLIDYKLDDILNESETSYFINIESKDYQASKTFIQSELENKVKAIKELPQSSVIDMNITFREKKSLAYIEELRTFYPSSEFQWAALGYLNMYDDISQQSYGVSLLRGIHYDVDVEKKYPNLLLLDTSVKGIETYYNSVLQMFKDNEKYYQALMNTVNRNQKDSDFTKILDKQIQEAKDGVEMVGVKVSIKRDDFIEMYDKGLIADIRIFDARLSSYSN